MDGKTGKYLVPSVSNLPGHIKNNKFIVLDKSKVPDINQENKVDFAREHGLSADPKTDHSKVKMNSMTIKGKPVIIFTDVTTQTDVSVKFHKH